MNSTAHAQRAIRVAVSAMLISLWSISSPHAALPLEGSLAGVVVDATTGRPVPARLHVEGTDGSLHTVETASESGSAVPYRKERLGIREIHTTLSAHEFRAQLPVGEYRITATRGKEYLSTTVTTKIGARPARVRLELRRFVDMPRLGWYSGETHVHRSVETLPNIVLAEDLHVTFPLTHWVTHAFTPPSRGDRSATDAGAETLRVDDRHVIWPRNTEYEIFSVGEKRHTLGAFFLIGHRRIFDQGIPPLAKVREAARADGALIELDKHNWPWSMAIVPILDVDLFELANNHVWRAGFGFREFGEAPAEFMNIERHPEGGFTERGWIEFGFRNYYALLNAGYRLRPTAGTASGVHPVPLGFGRVYARVEGELTPQSWLRALNRGSSFVTTGPMLFAQIDGRSTGATVSSNAPSVSPRVTVRVLSEAPVRAVEFVVGGRVTRTARGTPTRTKDGAWELRARETFSFDRSTWIAVRVEEARANGRFRFAHSSPTFFDLTDRPQPPVADELDYLVHRVRAEIERSRGVVPAAAIEEYESALRELQAKRRAATPGRPSPAPPESEKPEAKSSKRESSKRESADAPR